MMYCNHCHNQIAEVEELCVYCDKHLRRFYERDKLVISTAIAQSLTAKELAARFGMKVENIHRIFQKHGYGRASTCAKMVLDDNFDSEDEERNDGLLPCRLQVDEWPLCSGSGCYHAVPGRCQAYDNFLEKHPGSGKVEKIHARDVHYTKKELNFGALCK